MTANDAIRRAIVAFAAFLIASPFAAATLAQLPLKFFADHCVDCHNEDEANGNIRLDDLVDFDWQDAEEVAGLERVFNAVYSKAMPPEDASQPSDLVRIKATDAIHVELLHRVRPQDLVRRLSRSEYESTIRDLIGIDFDLPTGFPSDFAQQQFDNSAEGLVLSAPLLEAYFHAAISVADQILPPTSKPVPPVTTNISANGLVISYSSGHIIDDAMRLASRTGQMWRSSTWPEKFEVRHNGVYRIRVSASKFAPGSKAWPVFDQPMRLQIRARSLNERDGDDIKKQRLLAEFDVTANEMADFECDVELFESETPVFHFANALLDSTDKPDFGETLRKLLTNDERLLAGWQKIEHGSGIRGGPGWDRVKAIRDADDLDMSTVETGPAAVEAMVKRMLGNPTLYMETVIYQLFEEGPALELHHVNIEGPLRPAKSPLDLKRERQASRFLGDRQAVDTDAEFASAFLKRFLPRAFRRPVDAATLDAYSQLVRQRVDSGGQLNDGLHLAIRTALMSPNFLYRSRRSQFDDYELATRLAFFLTGSMPDEKLTQMAARGKLSDRKILQQQTLRLLNSPEIKRFVNSFTSQWLETHQLQEIMPDPQLLRRFSEKHREAMQRETELFFTEILKQNLPLETFIQPDFTFVDRRLAKDIYSMKFDDLKDGKLTRVSLDPRQPYGGLLGQAGIMMATANGVDTQPVVRGVWVLENILGDPPPEPPNAVPALTPDTRNATTVRELLAAHRADDSCASCHRKIDPLGFVLENFDPVGRWRTHYPANSTANDGTKKRAKPKKGPKIDANSTYVDGTRFRHVDDLKQHVVANIDQFAACLSEKLLAYATGRPLTYAERCEVDAIVRKVEQNGNGFRDLLLELVASETFRTR